MLELVFVIVILGIMASMAMGRMDRDLKQEAATTILSHIRLAQQLALRDNKHRTNNDSRWQRTYWRFEFQNCDFDGNVKPIYAVGSADLNGILDKAHAAIDPVNGKYLFGSCTEDSNGIDVSEDVFAGQHFGVQHMELRGCTAGGGTKGANFGFDYLGRPHIKLQQYDGTDFYSNVATRDCNLTVTMSDNTTFSIIIEKETGNSYVEGQKYYKF